MIEARVRTRQHLTVLTVPANIELDSAEAVNWRAIAPGHEGEELLALIVCEVIVDDFPEPLGLGAFIGISLDEPAVLLPSFKVKYARAAD
jgi:hypothetical protein